MADLEMIFRSIVDFAPEPILIVDRDYDIVFSNRAAAEFLGSHLVGRNLRLVLRHPDILAGVAEAFANQQAQILPYLTPAPTSRSFDISFAPYKVGGSDRVVAIVLQETTIERETEKMRSDFVSNVSHELRSPLATLIGFIETLGGPAADDPEAQRRFLAVMASEASRMAHLIDDLLSLSKVEVNRSLSPTESVNIDELLGGVVDRLEMRASEREIKIVQRSDAINAVVMGDYDELVQVFQNLIENAIKYAAEQSEIEVEVSDVERIPDIGGEGIAVTVIDQSEGIAAEHIARLTERFYRIDKSRSRKVGGTGLGLAIVKHIVNRHRGRLQISSTLGQGSSFTVYLPR
jgi:two-component system phosphate regulon sensor histidine kinase PhoR